MAAREPAEKTWVMYLHEVWSPGRIVRVRPLLLGLSFLVAACGADGAQSTQAPSVVRLCGDLDVAEPQDPAVTGEDEFGCPVFEPIPCARPRAEYDSVCGSGCNVVTAIASDGDEWLLGCVGGMEWPAGCIEIEPRTEPPPLCLLDPEGQEAWWFTLGSCGDTARLMFVFQTCWEPCDTNRSEALRDLCGTDSTIRIPTSKPFR